MFNSRVGLVLSKSHNLRQDVWMSLCLSFSCFPPIKWISLLRDGNFPQIVAEGKK